MILYHYTTAAGLHDIVASRSLWTSHYRFLNDTSEFLHGWKIVLDAIDRLAPRSEISHRLPGRRSHSFVNIAEKFMASSDL